MALKTLIFSFLVLSFHTLTTAATADQPSFFVRSIDREMTEKKENYSHFRFYWQDIVGGANATSIPIIESIPKFNLTSTFGLTRVIDNALTVGPNRTSKLVGRAHGFYVSTSQTEYDFLMIQTFVLFEGVYNGSSITFLARNPINEKVRELPVVGGVGRFRFAKGYARVNTISFDYLTGDTTVEYNVYVSHYHH